MIRSAHRRAAAVLLLLLVVSSGCGEGPASGDVEVRLAVPVWEVAEELRIGSLDDPEQALTTVRDVVVGPGGALYVAQRRDQQIRVFGPAGEPVRVIGGPGEGPREFGSLSSLVALDDGLWVLDSGNGRRTFISWEGEFGDTRSWSGARETMRFEEGGLSFFVMPQSAIRAVPVGDGTVIVNPNRGYSFSDDMVRADVWEWRGPSPFLRLDGEGMVADTVVWGWQAATSVRVVRGGHRYGFTVPFGDAPLYALSADPPGVVVVERTRDPAGAPVDSFRVSLLDADADTAWSRSYPYRPVSVTEDRLRQEMEGLRAGNVDPTDVPDDPDPPGPDEMLRELERRDLVPAHLPPVTAVKPAQDGTLWLRREATGEDAAVWLVLSGEDGEPRGEVTLPADQEVITALGDVLVVLEEDELEVPYILRYRIER